MHPRPQLTRENWQDLSGTWGFAHDDGDVGVLERWWERGFDRDIVVPFPPESRASGVHDPAPHPIVWYRKEFTPPAGERVILHFGAVDYRATVWVNGHQMATHTGGHVPFQVDITAVLSGGTDTVVVRAEDRLDDLTQPRGKQYWQPEPEAIWYHRTTGIWQPVWLESVPATHVSALAWTPARADASVGVRVEVTGPTADIEVRLRLRVGDRQQADDRYRYDGQPLMRQVALPTARNGVDHSLQWSPSQPVLIDATLDLIRGDAVIDTVTSYFGLRDVGVQDGRFVLNGDRVFLRMVLAQGYWPESHLAAPSEEALRREVVLIKELGFNGVRIHQKVEDPRFLYWCDRLGLLVWGEMASAYEYSADGVARFTAEWLSVVRRDYSHPSVVTWVTANESWGVPALDRDPRQRHFLESLYHLTHAVDATRPVISNDGWEHATSDIWGVHDYSPDAAGLAARYGTPEAVARTLGPDWPGPRRIHLGDPVRAGQPLMISEFGGLSYVPSAGERWFGYRTVPDGDALVAIYGELVAAMLASEEVAGYCYTQLTDTEQEVNGLLTEGREHKVDPSRIREINQAPAASVPPEQLHLLIAEAHRQARGDT